MSMTLNIPEDVAKAAKAHAAEHGVSVSAKVTGWLRRWASGDSLDDMSLSFMEGYVQGTVAELLKSERTIVLSPEVWRMAQQINASPALLAEAMERRIRQTHKARFPPPINAQTGQPEMQEADTHEQEPAQD